MGGFTMRTPGGEWEPVSHGTTSFPVYQRRIWNVPREAVEGFQKGGFILEGETPEGFEVPHPPRTWPTKGSLESKER